MDSFKNNAMAQLRSFVGSAEFSAHLHDLNEAHFNRKHEHQIRDWLVTAFLRSAERSALGEFPRGRSSFRGAEFPRARFDLSIWPRRRDRTVDHTAARCLLVELKHQFPGDFNSAAVRNSIVHDVGRTVRCNLTGRVLSADCLLIVVQQRQAPRRTGSTFGALRYQVCDGSAAQGIEDCMAGLQAELVSRSGRVAAVAWSKEIAIEGSLMNSVYHVYAFTLEKPA